VPIHLASADKLVGFGILFMIEPFTSILPWTRRHLEDDRSWIYPLGQAEIDGFRRALDHALEKGKPMMQMSPDDFPIADAAERALRSVVASTQAGYGIALLRGFPADEFTDKELHVLCWGIGLQMGIARPEGKQSQFMSDVMAAGGQYRGPTGRGYNTNSALVRAAQMPLLGPSRCVSRRAANRNANVG
jgi:hypothetical protein